MGTPRLSVLIPALNEARTLARVVDEVLASDVELEVILIDDGSTDGTWDIMRSKADGDHVRAFRHTRNQGKGGAIRTGLKYARGELILIQDADLEYDPRDYKQLLRPIVDGDATVVYGTQAFSSHSAYSFWYVMGNRLVTLATNILFNCYISDMETGYKLMPRDVALSLHLQARGFELEPEITAKLIRSGLRIYEVPIRYHARSREEGRKLTAADGARALITLVRFRRWRPRKEQRR